VNLASLINVLIKAIDKCWNIKLLLVVQIKFVFNGEWAFPLFNSRWLSARHFHVD
jgi:hypothetical protein